MQPYYQDHSVTLYLGRAEHLLPTLPMADAIVTDPPYAETNLAWDRWPDGWVSAAAKVTTQMWCFGSLRMFMAHYSEFADWQLGQEIVWEKHNGSNSASDRFRRVHELAAHFYRGKWSSLYRQPQLTHDAVAKTIRRKGRLAHWGAIDAHDYLSVDGGPRLMTSVIYARSCHGYAVNETQKPEHIVTPLMLYSVPPDGLVIDCFAGSGTTLLAARRTGRRAIGIEVRESQCQHIVRRLAQAELLPPDH